MRNAILLLSLLVSALPAAAAPPPEKPGAALAALQLPPCDYKPGYWTPEGSLSTALAAGNREAVEHELEEFQASAERNHACETRMAWAFNSGFRFDDVELPAQLDHWVSARPGSWTAHTVRGVMWMDKAWRADGNLEAMRDATERATADLERAIALHPAAMVAHGARVKLFQVWHDPARVEAAYRRGIAIDPVSVYLLDTTLAALQPRWGGSLEATERIVAYARTREEQNPRVVRVYGYPDGWRALDLEVRGAKRRGERLRTLAFYSKALRYVEASSDWHYERVMRYRALGAWEEVAADSAYGIERDKKAERFWNQRIHALAELGRYDEALRTAREALQHLPGSVDLRWYEADVVSRMGRYDEAVELHRAALKDVRTPRQRFVALGGVADALMKAKRWAEAEPVLAEITETQPWHTLYWHRLAEARWQLGRRADAVLAYEQFMGLSEGKNWAEDMRMRAQEKIDVVRSGAEPPARAGEL